MSVTATYGIIVLDFIREFPAAINHTDIGSAHVQYPVIILIRRKCDKIAPE